MRRQMTLLLIGAAFVILLISIRFLIYIKRLHRSAAHFQTVGEYVQQGKLEEAIAVLKESLSKNHFNAEAHAALGMIYNKKDLPGCSSFYFPGEIVMTTVTPLRQRMLADLQLHGLSAKTQDLYVRAVRQLAEYYHKAPDLITEAELRQYLLYLQQEKQVAPRPFTVALCAIKFFYEYTLDRHWPILNLVRAPRQDRLPEVLSVPEVHQILRCLDGPRYRACLSTIYACGLRVDEGVHLQVQDIDGARQVVHVRQGKGSRDRYVPLPQALLESLRRYWQTHRHPVWLFPPRPMAGPAWSSVTAPVTARSVQRAFQLALAEGRHDRLQR